MAKYGNRQAAISQCLADINLICNDNGQNEKLYTNMFDKMNDEEFDQFIKSIDHPEGYLCAISPILKGSKIDTLRNIEIGKKWGHSFYQRIHVPPIGDTPGYLTPIPYMVIDGTGRRQSQLLVKKISVPDHNKSVDEMTGAPTGDSKGSKISYPELQVLSAGDKDDTLEELMKFRGGAEKAFRMMNTQAERDGKVSMLSIRPYADTVKSSHSLYVYLTGMHLRNTGLKN